MKLLLLARIAYYEAALRHLDPLHEDVPAILVHVAFLRDQVEA
jgi:hypothetical protein